MVTRPQPGPRCWAPGLQASNLLDGAAHDVWSVNADAEHVEEGELRDSLGPTAAIATVA